MADLTRNEFWVCIENCRTPACDMPEFNRRLESVLDDWDLPNLAAFHRVMWFDLGVYHDELERELWELMRRAVDYLGSDNAWDNYGGWLIAQGREFYDAVMHDRSAALSRIPSFDDVLQGESVIFVAQRVCSRKTDNKWGLFDLFGDDLKSGVQQGVDHPVN